MSEEQAAPIAGFRRQAFLGRGASGEVWRAISIETGEVLAIKVLRTVTQGFLLHFKQEFRALADLRHPNLVTYHGLWQEEGRWCLLMDLIEGTLLQQWAGLPPSGHSNPPLLYPQAELPPFQQPPAGALLVIAQGLVRGLSALHAAGKVHRDLKPENIVLRPDGQPVILDFGLVVDAAAEWHAVGGTLRYMAPEAIDRRIGPAADWFSLGMVLHEICTGRLPFETRDLAALRRRRRAVAPPVALLNPSLPPALAAFIDALLVPDPLSRADGAVLAARTGLGDHLGAPSRMVPFVGRAVERARLQAVFTQGGGLLRLAGPAGMGKSALVATTLAELRAEQPKLLVLSSRCHAQEEIPYKALDGWLDAVVQAVTARRDLAPLPGAVVASLVQTFPALDGLWAQDEEAALLPLGAALMALFRGLAASGPVVAIIDDLQWADADSAQVLADALLQGPLPITLLVVHRDEEPLSAAWSALLEGVPTISLPPLSPAEVCPLVGGDGSAAAALTVEASGHPYLIAELLQGVVAGRTLRAILEERIAAASPVERRLVELVAVHGAALPLGVLRQALGSGPIRGMLDAAITGRLLRTARVEREVWLVPYHDRVREVALAQLTGVDRSACHRALAEAFAAAPPVDPEVLAAHWEGAGETARAIEALRAALGRLRVAQAPAHEARLRRRLVALSGAPEAEVRALVAALVRSGQRAEAASRLITLSQSAPPAQSRADRAAAAEHYLRCGQSAAGIGLLRQVVADAGLQWPDKLLPTVIRILYLRWNLSRGQYVHQPAATPGDLARLDLLAALNRGLRFTSTFDGIEFSALWVSGALASDDSHHLTIALANEVNTLSAAGDRRPPEADRLAARVETLLATQTDPGTQVAGRLELSGAACLRGDFAAALRLIDEADALLPHHNSGEHVDMRLMYLSQAAWMTGQWGRLHEERAPGLVDARNRADRWADLWLRSGFFAVGAVLFGAPFAPIEAELDAILAREARDIPVLALSAVLARANLHIMAGEGRAALALVDRFMPPFRLSSLVDILRTRSLSRFHSLILQVAQLSRGLVLDLRLRAALCAGTPADTALAGQLHAALLREKAAWTQALAAVAAVGLARRRGADPRPVAAVALRQCQEAGLMAHGAALGVLLGSPTPPPHPNLWVQRRQALLLPVRD